MELFTVDTVLDTTDPGDGSLSLREALALANADADKDEVQFADALAGQTLVLTQGALRIEADLLIDGPPQGFTIDGDGKSGVLSIYKVGGPDPSVTLAAMTITGGKTARHRRRDLLPGRAAPLREHGDRQSCLRHCGFGGGIYGDKVTLYRSTVSNNVVEGPGHYYDGGGIRRRI